MTAPGLSKDQAPLDLGPPDPQRALEPHGWRRILLGGLLVAGAILWLSWPSQEGDPTFDARVPRPAHAPGAGPVVAIDEGHWNVHEAAGRYRPFVQLLESDGCRVESRRGALVTEALAGVDVLVVANALGVRGTLQATLDRAGLDGKLDVNGPAFSEAECATLEHWVSEGGALLLVADHAPAGAAARRLSEAFGVGMRGWYAEEPEHHDRETGNWGWISFRRDEGGLGDHPILEGRDAGERIHHVLTFTGQALEPPAGAAVLLRLSPRAVEYPRRVSEEHEAREAAGLAQAVALEHGRGRVVVAGEAAMLTSQLLGSGARSMRIGMSRQSCDDRQLTLNVVRWLSRSL